MKRRIGVWLAVSAVLLASASESAHGQRVATAGQTPQRTGPTVKKKYSRGVKETPEAEAGLQRPVRPGALRWEPLVGMDSQIFPSFIVSTATMRLPQEEDAVEDPRQLGEALGFIGVALEGVPANARIRVEAKANAVMDASVFEGRAADGAGDYQVYPKINYRYDALLDWRQPMPLNISLAVSVDDRPLGTQSATVTVRSINDCPFVVVGDEQHDEEDLDLSWMFAAYVNENHPGVDTITRDALEAKIVEEFSGYQNERQDDVVRQVYAIWHTLQQRGLRYSDISRSSAESPVVMSQHVRLFDEALAARQANCVEGTALLAAVLRKIGIEPYLALIPGHMFLVFDLDETGEDMLGLETTLMGAAGAAAAPAGRRRRPRVPAALTERFRGQASFTSFTAAIEEGTALLEKHMRGFESDDPDYQLISVSEARELGILPLPYRRPAGVTR